MNKTKGRSWIQCIGFPKSSYELMLGKESFNSSEKESILTFVTEHSLTKVVVFGASRTGRKLKDILGERFVDFVESGTLERLREFDYDAIMLATSPVHYNTVVEQLSRELGEKLSILVTLYSAENELPIACVVESQPCSGTHYTIDNLVRCLTLGQASVFKEGNLVPSQDERLFVEPGSPQDAYLVKSHFYSPLHYPEYRYAKTIFLVRYVFDCYHSWAQLLGGFRKSNYRLTADSKEWQILRAYIPLNKRWLSYTMDKFVIRYEDYLTSFEDTRDKLASFLGGCDLSSFASPRRMDDRLYWSDQYLAHYDEIVFRTLFEEFAAEIEFFWPEKMETLVTTARTR